MGSGEIDQLSVNTIRVLAVSEIPQDLLVPHHFLLAELVESRPHTASHSRLGIFLMLLSNMLTLYFSPMRSQRPTLATLVRQWAWLLSLTSCSTSS